MLSQTDLLKLIKILKEEYPLAKSKKQKSRILNHYCLNSGNFRKYIIRTIRSSVDPAAKKRRNRKSVYDRDATAALIKIWELLNYPCGQKLKPMLETELDGLVRSGQLTITDETAKKLKKISSATIDRKLKQHKETFLLGEPKAA
jgi:Fic family protein